MEAVDSWRALSVLKTAICIRIERSIENRAMPPSNNFLSDEHRDGSPQRTTGRYDEITRQIQYSRHVVLPHSSARRTLGVLRNLRFVAINVATDGIF